MDGSEAKCLRDSLLTNGRNSEKSYSGRSYTKEQIEKRMISQSFLLFLHLLENSESTSSIELGNKVFSFFLCDILFNNGRDIKKNLITLAQAFHTLNQRQDPLRRQWSSKGIYHHESRERPTI
ncbi:hypothetical protein Bca52824_072226 [Brassica carinata]|uniref:Uncharacterized protein n=1 Tax=Brassica carinata TaxID=52824 RepID=A0A8X7Q833_BRACI|nr:hypothetical protein Bca52824_072226 [Brassica carinata]